MVSFRHGMGSKREWQRRERRLNAKRHARVIVFYVRMSLAFATRSSQGTHDKVNGRFQSWTVINYRDTQQRGAYVRMFGVLWTLVSLAAVYVSSHNRAPLQKGGALSDETKTAARHTRSSLTRPQSSVFGSHTWPKGARGVMGRMKTKGRDDCLILTRNVVRRVEKLR